MSDFQPSVGTVLEGRYALTRAVPDSDPGVASFEGTQVGLERPVSIKILNADEAQRPERHARFLREGRTLAQLEHPNIAHVLEVGVSHGRPFVVRDRRPGRPLEEHLQGARRFSWKEVHHFLRGVLSALTELHGKGLLHRDLSSRSVSLDDDGHPRLFDLQAVSAAQAREAPLTGVGVVLGDPRVAAPEQLAGLALDPRADLYSVGALAHHLVVGHYPYAGRTPAQLLASQAHPAPKLRALAAIPPEAEAIAALIDQLVEIDPARRPGSAAEALTALGSATAVNVGAPAPVEAQGQRLAVALRAAWAFGARAVGDGVDRVRPHLKRAAVRSGWVRLTPPLQRGISVGLGLLFITSLALAARSGEETPAPDAAVRSLPPPAAATVDPTTLRIVEDARAAFQKRRLERALDAYLLAATRTPAALSDEDLARVVGALARKDWLTATAEKVLVRVGPRARPALERAADDPKSSPFLRRRATETLAAL